jgi:hypothetical protein
MRVYEVFERKYIDGMHSIILAYKKTEKAKGGH